MNTIAELKALDVTKLVDGRNVYVSGYYAENDGGGGIFVYDATSTATQDNGSVIKPTRGSGRYLAVFDGQVNVRRFGAKGDNVTDDASAIQAAIDFAAAGGTSTAKTGLKVYFPHGAYLVKSTLEVTQPCVVLEGESLGGEEYGATTGHGTRIIGDDNSMGDDDVINISASYCCVRNLNIVMGGAPATFYAAGRTSGAGLNISGAAVGTVVEHCNFANHTDCVHVSDATQQRFFDCRFLNYIRNGVRCSTYDDVTANTADRSSGRFIGCRFQAYGTYQFAALGVEGSGIKIESGGGFLAIGCNFVGGNRGINMEWETAAHASIHFIVNACTFDEPFATSGEHIRLSNAVANPNVNVSISGCTFSLAAGKKGIYLVDGLRSVTITGNSFNCLGDAISVIGSVQTFAITGNTFYAAGNGIRLNSAQIAFGTITGNVFDATLAMPLIDAAGSTSNLWITGNTNVNETKKPVLQPTVPASGVARTNTLHKFVDAYLIGGNTSVVTINGEALPAVPNPIHLAPGDDLILTYTVPPTWEWFTR